MTAPAIPYGTVVTLSSGWQVRRVELSVDGHKHYWQAKAPASDRWCGFGNVHDVDVRSWAGRVARGAVLVFPLSTWQALPYDARERVPVLVVRVPERISITGPDSLTVADVDAVFRITPPPPPLPTIEQLLKNDDEPNY